MGSEVIVVPIIFGVVFGIFYLFISARNKERLALIEKGGDASIFYGKRQSRTTIWKVIILNFSLLLMGIGIGVFLASMMHLGFGLDEEVAYPGSIFLMAGIGLFLGVHYTKKMTKEED